MFLSGKKVALTVGIMGLVCSCIFLSACSKSGKGVAQNFGKGSEKTQNKVQSLGKNNVHPLCETASLLWPTNQNPNRVGMECTVKAATLYAKPEAANIDRTQVSTDKECHYNLKTEEPETLDFSKAHFLLCDVTLKNIHLNQDEMNITALSLVYLSPDTKELKPIGFPAYFPKSKSSVGASDYYHYALPVGQSMDAKIGWWVDLNECKKENLYVVYNYSGDKTIQQAWKLGL